ncbi:MAG: FAD-dependent oxidoreductase [Cellvibrionales bacterium]|nr:FAD-dependent oxidoreductase [Cellvibrionales bacterium]
MNIDLLIVGGGIAGLWTLAKATEAGFSCVLLEKDALGAGQTIASQGIIHGGLKYALGGKITKATEQIRQMPTLWQQHLAGRLSPALTETHILSKAHYFVPSTGIDSQLVSFLGSKLASGYSSAVRLDALPPDYQRITQKDSLYQLHEWVLDIPSLLTNFKSRYGHLMTKHRFLSDHLAATDQGFTYQLDGVTINTRFVLQTAGAGNETSTFNKTKKQLRPLHMVMIKSDLPKVYAHFIGAGSKPLMTVTTHQLANETVWYIGGELAESGNALSSIEQKQKAIQWLNKAVPAIDWQTLPMATFRIDRAEAKQLTLFRPDDVYLDNQRGFITGFPTKLALAPRFADKVLALLNQTNATSQATPHTQIKRLGDSLPIASPPWAKVAFEAVNPT